MMESVHTSTTGCILHLQRLSTEDGPGLRTTVFFKGCPLHCRWCHNPESISPRPQVQWLETRCIGCDTCLKACSHRALERTPAGLRIDWENCTACGVCAGACPTGALECLGREIGVDKLVRELLKDSTYFGKSGGGVTLSGGEPTLQPEFAAALLRKLKAAGVPTALDTCGLCKPETLLRLVQDSDCILYDVKAANPTLHQELTGASNRIILENLALLRDTLASSPAPKTLWVRTPLIPDATATPENIRAIGELLAGTLGDTLQRWELCAFNNLCRDKYRRLGMEWEYKTTPLMGQDELDTLLETARLSGVNPDLVFLTGAARLEERI